MLDMLGMKYFQSKYFAMGNTLVVGLSDKMGNQLKTGPNYIRYHKNKTCILIK